MIEAKFIEIRDAGTTIPAIAFRIMAETDPQSRMMQRAGYGLTKDQHESYVFLMKLDGCEIRDDPFDWNSGSRTMKIAHLVLCGPMYTRGIEEIHQERARGLQIDMIANGGLLDVEWVLGLRDEMKATEFGS